jgi:monofunctional biosynthetic peptidoglycan transglycosylase
MGDVHGALGNEGSPAEGLSPIGARGAWRAFLCRIDVRRIDVKSLAFRWIDARKIARWAAIALGALAAFAVLLVALYRFIDPPTTWTVTARALGGADVRRTPVPLAEVSPNLIRAVIAAEDSRFCSHNGFDTAAIRAAMADARRGERLRGASTISQQTAKNAFLFPGGGFPRKIVEAGFTVMIETAWPKRRIMEVYLNAAEWGDGLFGAEAAAQARFGKPASELTTREAALMAAVLPSPNHWRLDPPSDFVRSRARTLQARMGVVRRDGLAACVLGSP